MRTSTGGMSVTNNIEAILAEIADEIGTSIYQMPIVYPTATADTTESTEEPEIQPFYSIGAGDEKTRSRPPLKGTTK